MRQILLSTKNCAGWRRTRQDWCGWYWQLCVCQSCPWKNSIQKLCSKIQWNKAKLLFNNWKKCCMLLPHRWLQWLKYFATFSTYVAVCRPLSYNLDLDIDLGQKWFLTFYQIRPSIQQWRKKRKILDLLKQKNVNFN